MNDLLNGLFEFSATFFLWLHVRRIYHDKEVAGASVTACFFFTLWGYWNLYYYPSLDQWWSFAGGIGVVGLNTAWLAGMLRYGTRKKRK